MLMVLLAGSAIQGIANILFKFTAERSVGFLPLAAYFALSSLILLGVVLVREQNAVGQAFANPTPYLWALAAAVALAGANYLLFSSLATMPAATAFTVYNTGCTLVTVLIGVVLLGERLSPLHILGIVLAILSVVLMTWPRTA